MKNITLILIFLLSAGAMAVVQPSVKAANITNNQYTASANSIACFGEKPGYCKDGGEFVSHSDFVSIAFGEPAFVTSITYFSDRDDKVILEYKSKTVAFIKLTQKAIINARAGDLILNTIHQSDTSRSPLTEWETYVVENCPTVGGCVYLLDLIARLNQK